MKQIFLLLLVVLSCNVVLARQQENYSRAKIYLDRNGHTIRDLATLGLAVDHGESKKNTFFISDFSDSELKKARDAGFKIDIIIPDVAKYYREQNSKKKDEKTTSVTCSNSPAIPIPAHFRLGSYAGGYFTYDDMLSIIDSMHMLYPTLVSAKQQIDTFHSIQGLPLYWIRISNNPSVDQPAKPQALYTAIHHAREPECLSATIYYLWYLLENYSTDTHIKSIIDNTELYFIPCLNPDGYLYNIMTNPLGGGMLRKNLRDNLDGTFGVDLNRNYATDWGYDNIGSSNITSSDTYRGTGPFSEPETQAVKWFAENHHFMINLNYHTYNNDILYPWGYLNNLQTVDSATYFSYGSFLTQYNHYRYGTCNQTLDYTANGDSDDWMYGDTTTKKKVFGFTPEVGNLADGFYPPTTSIIPDCQDNLLSNINAASLLLPFANISSSDDRILIRSTGYLHYTLQRLGFPATATYTVNILPLDSWMTVSSTPNVYTSLTMLQQVTDSISYTFAAGTPNGQSISYVLQLYNGLYYTYDTVQFFYGQKYSVTTPSTSTLTDWTNSGWGLCTSVYYTAPASIVSNYPGCGNYMDNSDLTISTTNSIDLTYSTEAWLQFYSRWAVESNYDYVMVEASIAGSGVWNPLCGKFTKPGTSYQLPGGPIYDGQQPNWVQEQMDLHDYIGQKIYLQYELISDPAVNYEGFYFSNVNVTTVQDTAVVINHTAVNNVATSSPSLTVYPNPASEQLTISLTGISFSQPLSAALYDCFGREAMSFTITQPKVSIDISQLPVNVYYLKVNENGNVLPVQKVDVFR